MTEAERQRAIRLKLSRQQLRPPEPLPTGIAALDAALGGGWPRGRISELYGPPGCGKTTLALQAVAHLQGRGLTAGWIDADHALDPAYAAALGVVIERLVVAQPATAEQALEIGRRLAASAAVELLVIDSAAALVPSLELEAPLGESGRGLQARVLASRLRGLAREAFRSGAVALFLNQTRGRPGEAETTAGGPSLRLFADVRIALHPTPGGAHFRMLKNKAGGAFASGELRAGPNGFSGTP